MMQSITKWLQRYADIATGWAASLSSLTIFGVNLPPLVLTSATIWWTIERARETRAKRRTEELRAEWYAQELGESKPVRRGLIAWARRMTGPSPLDDDPQEHHRGK
jgi:regulator of protease activity HflC (stomatin/prohibitin superfamily)